jgi:hypothetical protein
MNKKSIILPTGTLLMIVSSIVVSLLPKNTKVDPYFAAFIIALAIFLLGLIIYKNDNSDFAKKGIYKLLLVLGLLAIPYGFLIFISASWR